MHDLDRRALWPLVDPVLADERLADGARRILDGSRHGWDTSETIDLDTPGLGDLLTRHRLWTLLPLDAVGERHRDRLRRTQIELAAVQLRLRSAAAELLELLRDEGFDTRVLKGLATAELDYPDRTLRHTGDVDLAVRLDDLGDVRSLLTDRGYRDHPTPFSPYLLYGWTLDAPDGVEIDLHTRLFRRSPLSDDLFADPGEALESLPGTALPREQRLVHAAGHFMISPPGTRRMSGLLDVTRLLENPTLDLAVARRFARALGVESLVGAGIRLEAELSGRVATLAELDEWRAPDWVERSTRLVPERRLVLDHLARFREVPVGWRLRYLPTWLLPSERQRSLFARSAKRRVRTIRQRVAGRRSGGTS